MQNNIFDSLGLNLYQGPSRSIGGSQYPAYVSFRQDKNNKKHLVFNFSSSFIENLGWKSQSHRIHFHVNGGKMCGVSAQSNGGYALIAVKNSRTKLPSRYEIKITWTHTFCPEPMLRGAFPLEVKEMKQDGKNILLLTLPDAFFKNSKEITNG